MDRRAFLKTGAVAAAAAAAGDAAPVEATDDVSTTATQSAAPALTAGCRELSMAVSDTPEWTDAAMRLTRRIEVATAGRFRLHVVGSAQCPLEAVASGAADLYLATELQHYRLETALAYFAGLPLSLGLLPDRHHAWLTVSGGQWLWDDLGSTLGIKPLLAGYAGRPGLWLARPASEKGRFDGLRLHVTGFAGDMVRRLGGEPVNLPARDLAAALAAGRIDGAEGFGSLVDMALGLPAAATHYFEPGFAEASALCLGVRSSIWHMLSAGDQAVIEACVAEEVRISLAEALVHPGIARSALIHQHGVVPMEASQGLVTAFARAARDELTRVAEANIRAQRIDASYRAFRELTGEAPV